MRYNRFLIRSAIIIASFYLFPLNAYAGLITKLPSSLGLSTDLEGYWTFDGKDISGTTATDKSGNGNNGTITGAIRDVGKIGQALRFNGTTNKVQTPVGVIGNSVNSVCAWIYPRNLTIAQAAIIDNTKFQFYTSNQAQLILTSNGGTTASSENHALQLNQWQHVCGVRDSSGANSNLYVNGNSSGNANQNSGAPTTSAFNTFIGSYGTGSGYFFNGSIDDVRIYSRVLSAFEIKRLYNLGQGVKVKTPATAATGDLVAYWTMDNPDIAGTTLADRSGNGYTGTMSGGTTKTIGKLGQALNFNGTSSYVEGGAGPPAVSTIAFWAYPKTTTEYFVNLNDDPAYIWSNAGTVTATGFSDPTIYVNGQLSSTLIRNQWQHVVVVGSPLNASNFEVGRTQGANYLEGKLDEVRLYGRALSADEAKQVHNLGVAMKVKTPTGSLTDGLVGYWTFDGPDISGTTALDKSGNGNNGTLTNGPTKTIGKLGQGLRFTGRDSSATVIVTTSDFVGTNPATFCAWLYPRTIGGGSAGRLVDNRNYIVAMAAANEVRLYSGGVMTFASTGTSYNFLNKWSHFCGTRDAVGTANMYVNGNAIGIANQNSGTPVAGITAIAVGGRTDAIRGFDGYLDDVRIYDRVLAADEVKKLYNLAH